MDHQFGSSPTCAIRRAEDGVEGRIQSLSQTQTQPQDQQQREEQTWSPPAFDAVREGIAVIGS